MSKLNRDQSGFSALEAILLCIIVGIVGFTGWYVWQAKQTASKTLDEASKSATANNDASKSDQASTAIIFKNEASFQATDKQQILNRIVNPMVFYHNEVIKVPLKSITIEKNHDMKSPNDSRFILSAVDAKQNAKLGFIFGENNKIGYWQPLLCDEGGCIDYSEALKAKFPENYDAYVACKAASDSSDKQKTIDLACM